MVAQFSIDMNFDYELVMPRKGTFGKRIGPNEWDGLVGDLMVGVGVLKVISIITRYIGNLLSLYIRK